MVREIVRLESKLDVLQSMETFHHQSTANEGSVSAIRNLGHNQRIKPAPAGRSATTTLVALFYARHETHPRPRLSAQGVVQI